MSLTKTVEVGENSLIFKNGDDIIGTGINFSSSIDNLPENEDKEFMKVVYFSGMSIYVVSDGINSSVFSSKGPLKENSGRPGGKKMKDIFTDCFCMDIQTFGDKFKKYKGVHQFSLTGSEYVNTEKIHFGKYCLIYHGTSIEGDKVSMIFNFRSFSKINDPYPDFIFSNIKPDEINPVAYITYKTEEPGNEETFYDEESKLTVYKSPKIMSDYNIFKYFPESAKLAERVYIATQTNQTDNMTMLVFNILQYKRLINTVERNPNAYFPCSEECMNLTSEIFNTYNRYYTIEEYQNSISKHGYFNNEGLEIKNYSDVHKYDSNIENYVILSFLFEVMPFQRHSRIWEGYIEYRKVRRILISLIKILKTNGCTIMTLKRKFVYENPLLDKASNSFYNVVGSLVYKYSRYEFKGDYMKIEEFVDSFIDIKQGHELYSIKRFVDNFKDFKY